MHAARTIFFLLSSSTVVLCQDPALAAPAPAPTPVPVQSGDNSVRGFRTIVTYLGTDFVMPDGCPLPACGETRQDRDCRKQKLDIKQKYDECLASEDGQYIGCVTDVLPNHSTLTIPVYANYCSAVCYEKNNEVALARLERCPYAANKQPLTPGVQRLFG